MSFQLEDLKRLTVHGPVARVVVADSKGSVPREAGASMLVTPDQTSGTIGGGALEFAAIERALAALQSGADRLDREALGPSLGQCCGGAVTVLTEIWDQERLSKIHGDVVVRRLPGSGGRPLAPARVLASARSKGRLPGPKIIDGWMVEPVLRPSREVWVWGAGHVGRAIVQLLAPLPDLSIRWADIAEDRFPPNVVGSVETLIAESPADLVTSAADSGEHLVLTHSHDLDLEICHRVLSRSFASLGLIGSETKKARFLSRLKALGHTDAQLARIDCPIGDTRLGKHPQAIAIGVAADIVHQGHSGDALIGAEA